MKFNKIFILMFVMILLLGTVSAVGWDNKLTYSNNDLKIELKNWFGLGADLGTAELKSHNSVDEIRPVKLGTSVVMWYDVNFVQLYRGGLGDIEIINVETGKVIDRNYQFVYWENETYQVPNYICNDILNVNGTIVNECFQAGTKDKTREAWIPYNSKDIPKGKIKIGVEINMLMDETLDIVWELGGKKIKKHAVVTSGAVETSDGLFTIFTFSNNGTFNVSDEALEVEFLIIGGGGGGDTGANQVGAGGGGGYVAGTIILGVANYTISVGIGGINSNGQNSSINSTLSAFGGGKGGAGNGDGSDGGSGGGGGHNGAGASSLGGQGNDGGDAGASIPNFNNARGSGGGGGAGEAGSDLLPNAISMAEFSFAGRGGNGTQNDINGTNVYWAGGGGGGGLLVTDGWNTFAALGGLGGGGNGGEDGSGGVNGVDGLGGGGGGAGSAGGGNGGSGIVIIRFFIAKTTINLDSPANNTNFTLTNNVTHNATIFDTNNNITNVTFWLDDQINATNVTAGLNNTVWTFNVVGLAEGNHTWNIEACNFENNCGNASQRVYSIDTNFPTIIVTSPTGDQGTFSSGLNLSLIWSANDTNIDVCQYDYEGSNTTIVCDNTEIGFIVTNSSATSLTFYVNDTFGQTSFNSTSWSYSFIENNITFTPNVFETSSHFFEINLSTSLTVSAISAELNYNGTTFISTATCNGFCIVNNTIDIPLVSTGEFENKSFFWEISIFNGTDSINVNTSSTEENVTRIHLEECDGSFTIEALNFTAYDEQNLSRIDPYLFDGDFDQWLGSGNVKRQSNFSQSSTSDLDLCITPEDETFFIDSTIEYDEAGNASLYTLRNYYFQNDTISNVSQDIFMYLLQSASSTSFILKVQDDALLPVANVLIETNRFYPGLNEFRIVQIAKTDDLGKSVGFFETEIVDYKFIITFNNDILLETGVQKVIPETSPFTLTFNLGIGLGEPWSSQIPLDNLVSTLIWNDTSGIITYTYTDSSTNLTLSRLFVIQQSLVNSSANSIICNVNSSLTSAMLTCNVGNDSGFYTASGFITRGSTETLDLQISFQIETLSAIVGLLGLFYGWFLILIASFMFRFNEIAGIWSITITVLLVNLIGLINFGGVFVTAIIGVAIFLTWLMSK